LGNLTRTKGKTL